MAGRGRKKGSTKLKIGDKVTNLDQNRDGVVVHIRNTKPLLKGWETKEPPFYDVHWTTLDKRNSFRSVNCKDELVKVLPRTKEIIQEVITSK